MIALTGATGLLGNSILRRLVAAGRPVRALVRAPAATCALDGLAVEILAGDVTDRDAVERLVEGADLVIHAAALVRIGRRDLDVLRRVNVGGTNHVVEACLRTGARLLHVSSVDALGWGTRDAPGDEDTPLTSDLGIAYVATKRESQAVVLAAVGRGLDATIVNPAFLLGPYDWRPSSAKLLLECVRRPLMPAPPGGNDFCHADDVAAGVIAAADRGHRGDCYVLGGEWLSYADAFRLFRELSGRRPRAWSLPRPLLALAGRAGDLASAIVGREFDLNSGAIAASSHDHHFSDVKARRELGYTNRGARAAAADALRWFRSRA